MDEVDCESYLREWMRANEAEWGLLDSCEEIQVWSSAGVMSGFDSIQACVCHPLCFQLWSGFFYGSVCYWGLNSYYALLFDQCDWYDSSTTQSITPNGSKRSRNVINHSPVVIVVPLLLVFLSLSFLIRCQCHSHHHNNCHSHHHSSHHHNHQSSTVTLATA